MSKVKDFMKAALISGVVVPVTGVLADLMETGAFEYNDGKLAHRFECAYSLNPDPEHKEFYSFRSVHKSVLDGWLDQDGNPVNDERQSFPDAEIIEDHENPDYVMFWHKEKYTAHPFLTGAMYVAVAGAAYARIRRKKEQAKLQRMMPQKTR